MHSCVADVSSQLTQQRNRFTFRATVEQHVMANGVNSRRTMVLLLVLITATTLALMIGGSEALAVQKIDEALVENWIFSKANDVHVTDSSNDKRPPPKMDEVMTIVKTAETPQRTNEGVNVLTYRDLCRMLGEWLLLNRKHQYEMSESNVEPH